MPLMKLPVRSLIVTLANAKILFSPGSRVPVETYKKNQGVTDIVGPNLFTLGGVPKAKSIYTEAKTWAPIGVDLKREDIPWESFLNQTPWPFENELTHIPILGMNKFNESVFIHKETKSLIVSDLIFNITSARGFGPWLILSLFDTFNKPNICRLFVTMISDKKLFLESMQNLLKQDFERIITCHGEVIESNGKSVLKNGLKNRGLLKEISK